MAKSLKDSPPTSSAARFLDGAVASRALQRDGRVVPDATGPEPAQMPAVHLRRWVKREFTLTPDADRAFGQLATLLRESTGTRLTNSHVFRALVHAVEPSFDALRREAASGGPYRLPGNGTGFERHRRQFELELTRAIQRALRA
jgi:hypothetical protein